MKIDKDQFYHGAALIQIAEHEKFTAINALHVGGIKYENAYRINDSSAVFLKYASKPRPPHSEYVFTFKEEHLGQLNLISKACEHVYIPLICVHDKEICCITYGQLQDLIELRRSEKGSLEPQYTVLVTAAAGKKLRIYVNAPGMKGRLLGEPILVGRNEFPNIIFS